MNVVLVSTAPVSRSELDDFDAALESLCAGVDAAGSADAREDTSAVGPARQYVVWIDLSGIAASAVADELECRFPMLQRFVAW